MIYKVTLTHNPQDYFDGMESEDLAENFTIDTGNQSWIADICSMLWYVTQGYKAVIVSQDGEG